MKRVLHVITSMNIGGMETIIMNMNRQMDHKKIVFDFLLFNLDENHYENEIKQLGGKVYKITPRRKSFIKNRLELNNFFKNHSYDIIHIHQGITYYLPLKLAKKYRVKHRIIHSHGVDKKYKKGILNLFRKYYVLPKLNNLATNRIVCSKLVLKDLFTDSVIDKKDYYLLNNSIDALKFKYNEEERRIQRKQLNIDENTILLGHVGHFNYAKNHEFMTKVFYEFTKICPNTKLLYIGKGIEEDNIKKLVKDLQIEDKVIFYGVSHEVDKLLQAMDIFLLPSRWEGLPLAIIEAQASGLLCFVSKEAVSKEAKITNNIHFISLNDSPVKWVSEIEKERKNYKRVDTYSYIVENGYDSKTEASKLQQFYLNLK